MPKTMEIRTKFTASDGVSRTVGKMQSRMMAMTAKLSRNMNKATRSMNRLAGGLTRGLKYGFGLTALAAGAVFMALSKTADSMDRLAKVSRQLSFPIEELQEWRFVAEQSGLTTDGFDSSLKKFTKGFGEAKFGLGTITTSLKKINPQLLKQIKNTESSADAFDLYIKAMRDAKSPAEQAALATAGFGRSGLGMINIAKASASEIEKLRAQMRENGIVTQEQAAKAEEYNDMMNRLKLTIGGFLVSVLTPLMPVLTEVAEKVRQWMVANRELIGSKLREYIQWIVDHADEIKKWAKYIGMAIVAFYGLTAAMNAVNAVMKLFNIIASINPMTLIVLAFIAAIVAIWYFRDEIDELMFHIFDWCAEVGAAFEGVWDGLIDYVEFVWGPLFAIFDQGIQNWIMILDFFSDVWNGRWDEIGARFVSLWDWVKEYYMGLWNGLVTFMVGIWAVLSGIVATAIDLWNGDFDSIGERFAVVWDGIKNTAGSVLDWIGGKFKPVVALVERLANLGGAVAGQTDAVADVAGQSKDRRQATLKGSILETKSSSENFDESYNVNEERQSVQLTIKDETKRARVTKGRLPKGMKLVHSGGMR